MCLRQDLTLLAGRFTLLALDELKVYRGRVENLLQATTLRHLLADYADCQRLERAIRDEADRFDVRQVILQLAINLWYAVLLLSTALTSLL